jgi:glycerophosphoryl diester phosphodiesterase
MRIVGHRGARGIAPENTIEALKKSLEIEVDEIAIDVRVTYDRIPVLHDNQFLRDPSGKLLAISSHNFAELHAHKPDLTTLEEAITFVNSRKPLYLEVKRGVKTGPVTRTLQNFLHNGWKPADFLLGSKSYRTLKPLTKKFPKITPVVIEPWLAPRAIWRAKRFSRARLSLNHKYLPRTAKHLAKRGYTVYVYTINDLKCGLDCHKNNLYGLITDNPGEFRKPVSVAKK